MTTVTVTPATGNEHLLLDLLNSTPVVRGAERDDLDDTIAWQQWRADSEDTEETAGREMLMAVRSALQAVVRGEQPATRLDPFLRGVRLTPAVTAAGVTWHLDCSSRRLGAARAVLAWDLVRQTRPGRLRACANPACRRFLLDRSKANTRRWCSMQICGNRMKARRHHASQADRPDSSG